MKRILVLLLTVCLLLSSFAFIAHAEPYTVESEGYDVYEIQYILKKFGYFTQECTGYFGEATSLAVKAYQQDRGFEATGIADEDTVADIRAAACTTATVNIKSRLNVRESADSQSEVIDSLVRSSLVYIYSEQGDWYHVETESGSLGFILKKYLTPDVLTGISGTITDVTDPVNVREKADLNAKVVFKVEKDAIVNVIGGKGDWFEIEHKDKKGYIFKKYVSIGGEGGSATSVGEIFDAWKGNVTASSLKLRSGPSTGYDTIKTMSKGTILSVVGQSGNWYYIELSDGTKGFCSKEYIKKGTGATTCTIKVSSTLNVRKGPGKSYDVVTTVKNGEVVSLLDDSASWYKIKTSSGKQGYVDSQYVKLGGSLSSNSSSSRPAGTYKQGSEGSSVVTIQKRLKTLGYFTGNATGYYGTATVAAVKKFQSAAGLSANGICNDATLNKMFASSAPTTNSSGSSSSNEVYKDANAELGQRIASYAQKFIGVPYLLGGNGPKVFDCSGYTKYVYAYFGISIPRTAQTQGYWNQGQKIKSASALQVGDLVFFNTVLTDKDLCDHAGIYIGNNKVIHASSGSKHCVTISDMTSSYYKTRFSWGRRLI